MLNNDYTADEDLRLSLFLLNTSPQSNLNCIFVLFSNNKIFGLERSKISTMFLGDIFVSKRKFQAIFSFQIAIFFTTCEILKVLLLCP